MLSLLISTADDLCCGTIVPPLRTIETGRSSNAQTVSSAALALSIFANVH